MSAPVECPHCGFMNFQEGKECARCREVLPGRENWVPKDEASGSDSEISLTGTDTHETLPPPLKDKDEEEKTEAPPGPDQSQTEEVQLISEPPPPLEGFNTAGRASKCSRSSRDLIRL